LILSISQNYLRYSITFVYQLLISVTELLILQSIESALSEKYAILRACLKINQNYIIQYKTSRLSAKKKKTEGLTPEEAVEQAKLREEYIAGYRRAVRHHIEGIKIVDEEGNDVTPEKLRQVQREKGLHGRSLDDPES